MPHGFPSLGEEEKPTAEEVLVFSCDREDPPDLRFLHYNDIYHLEEQSEEPAGGAGRFQTLCNYYRDDKRFADQVKMITVFSGDAYNPSTESAVTRGSHMVPILNKIGTDVACTGNHDFDFGAVQFERLAPRCNFPWILSNVYDPSEGEKVPLGHAKRTHMITASNGVKVGFMGLGEREWVEHGNSLPQNLEYIEMLDAAKELAPKLREDGADLVIALTHCRQERDMRFGKNLPAGLIDIILAGHDHWWEHVQFDCGTHLVRSGSDFKLLSYIKAWKKKKDGQNKWDFTITKRYVMRSIPEDKSMSEMAEKTMNKVKNRMERPVGYTVAALDARDSTLRLKESNYANFACDLLRLYYDTDLALMTGGTIRGDQVHTPGILRLKFITDSFPFEDPVVVIRVSGKSVKGALENGLAEYPKTDGKLLHVSGMKYSFNPNGSSGSRVDKVHVGDSELDLEKKYTIALRARMAFGHGKQNVLFQSDKANVPNTDGFETLKMESVGGEAEELVPDENGLLISMIVRQYFMSLQVLSGNAASGWGTQMSSVWGNIDAKLHEVHTIRESDQKDPQEHDPAAKGNVDDYGSDDEDAPTPGTVESVEHGRKLAIMRKTLRRWRKYAGLEGDASLPSVEEEYYDADWTKGISPKLEGRITLTEELANGQS